MHTLQFTQPRWNGSKRLVINHSSCTDWWKTGKFHQGYNQSICPASTAQHAGIGNKMRQVNRGFSYRHFDATVNQDSHIGKHLVSWHKNRKVLVSQDTLKAINDPTDSTLQERVFCPGNKEERKQAKNWKHVCHSRSLKGMPQLTILQDYDGYKVVIIPSAWSYGPSWNGSPALKGRKNDMLKTSIGNMIAINLLSISWSRGNGSRDAR